MATLQTVFLFSAAGVILFWLTLVVRGPRKIELPNVIAVLRYGKVLRAFGVILALAPPTILAYLLWALTWRDSRMLGLAGACFLVTSLIAGLLLLEVERTQIFLTEDGITHDSPWTGLVTLKWDEIEGLRYSAVNRWFVLAGAGRTIRVSRQFPGLAVFVATVRRKVAAERLANVAAIFDTIK
jgi:hypothetical protein